ncbi:hypothetical protein NNO07_17470 [Pseudomonas resinovorans]|uniref:Uncharacterized protein n=1 Tax=Metapseudomonas resinovorans TaxID=53412 RepID=A0ABT4Y7K8_METRE|nr:hypothetical protein [Pseudomonas resinovorans]MDA8484861.1 hypothetical protein [Pseudomonas resinovorans]
MRGFHALELALLADIQFGLSLQLGVDPQAITAIVDDLLLFFGGQFLQRLFVLVACENIQKLYLQGWLLFEEENPAVIF